MVKMPIGYEKVISSHISGMHYFTLSATQKPEELCCLRTEWIGVCNINVREWKGSAHWSLKQKLAI